MLPFWTRVEGELRKLGEKRPWLAKQTNIPISTVNTWCTDGKLPELERAKRIADTIGVTLDYLLTGEEPDMVINDSDVKEICDYVLSLDHDSVMEVKGLLKAFNYMSLTPYLKRENEKRRQAQ